MRTQLKTLALAGLLFAPALVLAQAPGGRGAPRAQGAPGAPGAGPRGAMPPSAVTQILNARRQLDLTPRQVAQLDSMERVLWTERERLRAQMMPARRDSVRSDMRPQMQALRQRDSTTRVAAERILTDTQRGKLREMQAERRGYERGRREAGMRGPNSGMRDGRMGRQGGQGRMQGGQRPGGRPGAMQGGARPLQRPE